MARINRKKNTKNNSFNFVFLKYLIILIFFGFFVFLISRQSAVFLRALPYFKIKEIQAAQDFSPMVEKKIVALKGSSIFDVDLKDIQNYIKRDYPGADFIRVTRKLPDQIQVQIEKRSSVAQVAQGSYFVLVDEEGFLIAKERQEFRGLPIVLGLSILPQEASVGAKISSRSLWVALRILKSHREVNSLNDFNIQKLDVANLSKIVIHFSPQVTVFLDQEFSDRTFHVLSMIFEKVRTELKDIEYIDLRFKEPVINKR